MAWTMKKWWFNSWSRQQILLHSKEYRPPSKAPPNSYTMDSRVSFAGCEVARLKVTTYFQSPANVTNEWSCISISPCAFMAYIGTNSTLNTYFSCLITNTESLIQHLLTIQASTTTSHHKTMCFV